MSRIPEKPGELVYPVDLFHPLLEVPANFRITLLHHPLNWYAQYSYHPLRKALRTYADAVLSGHEHVPTSGAVSESRSGDSLYFEAAALSPHEAHMPSAFSVLFFDLDAKSVCEERYALDPKGASLQGEPIKRLLRNVLARHADPSEIKEDFLAQLRDPGGQFTHPDKDHIELDDVFVFPDLMPLGIDYDDHVSVPADTVLSMDPRGQRLLLIGDEKAGKSTLLLRAFRQYHAQGLLPLYSQASEISYVSNSAVHKYLQRKANAQYVSASAWTNAPKEQRVILLDNIDRLPGGAKSLHRLIRYLERQFTCVLLTATSGFELQELVNKDTAATLMRYKSYEVLHFGYRLRYKLVRKWCLCGSTNTVQDLDKRVHDAEAVINSVIGRNLVPSRPIYLLILLQSCELQQQTELQNSSFAYYYQYLITKSLREAGVKPEHLNELFNYLCHLAWAFRSADSREIDVADLRTFNRTFCTRYVTVDLEQRLRLLTTARLLSKRGEYYSFTYPYVYFFFVGKYLGDNLYKHEIRELVMQWCGSLHKRENAHSILFLTHHRNDPWVVDQVSAVLKRCFEGVPPMAFGDDVAAINKLIDCASQLVLRDADIDKNQEEARKRRDEYEPGDDADVKDEAGEQIEVASKLNLLMRTAGILGQVLKNYYGSLERPMKAALLREVFDGPLRVLQWFIAEVARDPEGFLDEIEGILEEGLGKWSSEKKREAARKTAFQLLGYICTGAIMRTAEFVSTDKLNDDIIAVLRSNPSNAYRLINVATRLIRPGQLPLDEIRKLSKDLRHNVFAFTMLQSLAGYHLNLFHTREKDKQRLCALVDIQLATSREIDLKARRTKLLARK